MTAAELAEELQPIQLGSHKRVELQKDISGSYRYFSESITLPNGGEVVRISNQWGEENQWDTFKNHMEKYGYSIMQYRIVNINDSVQRLWRHCHEFNFFSAGGQKRYHTGMSNLRKNDLLFVCRVKNEFPGCIAYCRVESKQAVDVWDISTPDGGKLGDVKMEDERTYYDTFCRGRKLPDKAVNVEWLDVLPDNKPIKVREHRPFCTDHIAESDFDRLADAFNIRRTDSGK